MDPGVPQLYSGSCNLPPMYGIIESNEQSHALNFIDEALALGKFGLFNHV